jgi:hypothetical protein
MGFVTDFLGEITGANAKGRAAVRAGETQATAAEQGIAETQRQFDALVNLMQPYVSAGTGALSAQQRLLGLGTPEEQAAAIEQLQQSPMFQALTQQGENAILSKASATGGLRGGNTQAALAQFRPQVLSSVIQDQLAGLGNISRMGQASAAGQASAGMEQGTNVANLLGQAGAARAGGIIGQGNTRANSFGDLLKVASIAASVSQPKPGAF